MLQNLGSNTIRNVRASKHDRLSCVSSSLQKDKENNWEARWVLPKHFPVLQVRRYRRQVKGGWLKLRKDQKSEELSWMLLHPPKHSESTVQYQPPHRARYRREEHPRNQSVTNVRTRRHQRVKIQQQFENLSGWDYDQDFAEGF